MKLELVTHCWHYSRPLIFQLSSLFLFPPREVSVTMTVFFTESDRNTAQVVDHFSSLAAPPNVHLRPWALPGDMVTRRMIGRNLAALATDADWIWFTDCDYAFREGCLDGLADWHVDPSVQLYFPRQNWISRSHDSGDQELQRVASEVSIVDICADEYELAGIPRAIGGVQIARGDTARRLGYCRDSRFHRVPSPTWVPNRDDIWFRKSLGTRGTPMHLPGLYRIRHSARGGGSPVR